MNCQHEHVFLQDLINSGELTLNYPLDRYSDAFIHELTMQCEQAKAQGSNYHRLRITEPRNHALSDDITALQWQDAYKQGDD